MSDKEIRELLDEEAAAAEAARGKDEDALLPPYVKVSRPNLARSRVLQIRLNPEEFEALERIAARRGLPASTVARGYLLQMIRSEDASDEDVVAQLAAAADQIKSLLPKLVAMPGRKDARPQSGR